MPEPLLSSPALVSRPIDFRGFWARAGSMTCAALSLLLLGAGFVAIELLTAETSLPARALTDPIAISFPTPSPLHGLAGGGRKSVNTAVPPKLQAVPRRLEVVPVPPPITDDQLPPEVDLTAARDPGATNGIGSPGGDPNGEGPGGGENDCDGCAPGPGLGPGDGPGDGPGLVNEGTPGLEPPVVIPSTRIHPDYPDIARKARVSGSVLLLIVIDAEGRVGSIEVLESPDARFGFDLAAIQAVKRWRYRPARLGGHPVSVEASVRIEFTLAR